jgi:hypothetical protein
LEDRFVGQGGSETGFPTEVFMTRDFGSTFAFEKKGDLVFGEPQAFAIGTEIVS